MLYLASHRVPHVRPLAIIESARRTIRNYNRHNIKIRQFIQSAQTNNQTQTMNSSASESHFLKIRKGLQTPSRGLTAGGVAGVLSRINLTSTTKKD
jgi:hypothetical protein